MNKENMIVCIDLDDTLIDDNYKFELTFCDCIKVILEAFETKAPQIDEVLQIARRIDNEYLESWPKNKRYTPERLKATWAAAYATLCKQYDVAQKKHILLLLQGLVAKNYDPPYYIIPGAIEALTTLEQQGYKLFLVTAGTTKIQNRKIKTTGLNKFFKKAYVVEDGDKRDILENVVKEYGRDRVVMVGNSMRADINPALELGVKAIYIPRGSWHGFKAKPANKQYIKIKSIDDLVDKIKELDESAAVN